MEQSRPKLFNQSSQKQWSETRRYKHIHTGEYCTFEAYVAEYIVLRRAEKLNLGKPSYKFWTKGDPNHWLWKKQHGAAIQLKKKYSEEAILSAIKSKDFNHLLVLGIQNGRGYKVNPAAEKVVAKHQSMLDEKSKKIQVNEDVSLEHEKKEITNRNNIYSNKTSMLNKLRNL